MPKKANQKLTERQSDWLAKIKACEASGKSVKAFAESEGLRLQDLYSWKKTLVKKGVLPRTRPSGFQRAKIVETYSTEVDCRLVLPNGVTVILSGGHLQQILQSAMAL